MRAFSQWLRHPVVPLGLLVLLFLVLPLASRFSMNWVHPFGLLSDAAVGCLLLALLHRRGWLLSVPLLLTWGLLTLGNVELVNAVGRMPEVADLHYLSDAKFISRSTGGGGLSQPLLAIALGLCIAAYGVSRWAQVGKQPAPSALWLIPGLLLLAGHAVLQYRSPSAADQWLQFNLPHKLLAEGLSSAERQARDWLGDDMPEGPPDIHDLTALDLQGTPLLKQSAAARNVLIVTLEGIPGAYLEASRKAIHSSYTQAPMPRLSAWAERGMLTTDYVLHSHQTIRGLYAMLCGDYGKLDSGTPKGIELLNNAARSEQCLPAQLRQHGFSTHYLQGAGLRFMAKDQIMPRMGFDKTLGRSWFRNKPYLEFPWGMDDKSYFEGALTYVQQLRQRPQPWMLTLLTVGTHQPYSAPADYLARYPNAKQAATAYLDDAVADFLQALHDQGVFEDTLIIITSDESHGLENVRLASAWGFNLMFAPEQAQLPALKTGVYGHVDVTASVLDYFNLPMPPDIAGRSLLRDYSRGRSILSYTNGMLRQHDGNGTFTECDFRQLCRQYASTGFIADDARFLRQLDDREARLVSRRAASLDQSLKPVTLESRYQFAQSTPIALSKHVGDDWADNLIGAQYLELPKGTRTQVNLKIRAVRLDRHGASLQLKTKEYERDTLVQVPALPLLTLDQPVEMSFAFDNLEARKAFSFHLLGEGRGSIEILDFSVVSTPLEKPLLADHVHADDLELQVP